MNQELERVSSALSEEMGLEKEVIYKVIRWGWDEVREGIDSMTDVSIEYPKFGQWVVKYAPLSTMASKLYDVLIYDSERYTDNSFRLLTNKFLRLKKFLELIDKRIEDGYKINYKKPTAYYGGNKKRPNN